MIVSGIECPRCGDRIWSRHRHDLRTCECGYCFIDGGRDYDRIGYGVGLPKGMENDGTVPEKIWAEVNAETARIGKPRHIRINPLIERNEEMSKKEWKKVGKLRKVTDFRSTSRKSPTESLHCRIRDLLPDVQSITEVGVSRKTNKHLESELIKFAKKEYPGITKNRLQFIVGMALLDVSPCDVPGAEDFVLYVRE